MRLNRTFVLQHFAIIYFLKRKYFSFGGNKRHINKWGKTGELEFYFVEWKYRRALFELIGVASAIVIGWHEKIDRTIYNSSSLLFCFNFAYLMKCVYINMDVLNQNSQLTITLLIAHSVLIQSGMSLNTLRHTLFVKYLACQ